MEEIKREVIKKHLEGWERDLRNTSIEYFAKSGKVSGSFFMALKDMLDDYVEQLRIHGVVGQSKQFKCEKCGSDWGEVRATCFSCNYESEDLST
jgi:hypothetical protein